MKFSKIQTYKNEISKRLARPKRIYILPTKQGFYFLGINFIVFNLGNIYGNNMVLLLSFIMVAFAVVNMLLTHLNIKNVEIEGMTVHSEFADSPVEMSFKIKNKNNRAFKNLLLETWLPEKEPLGIITDIPKAQTALQVLHKGGLKRGYYQLNRLQLSTRSPSLLFVAWKVVSVECSFFIYPKRREESFFWDQEQSADKTRNEFEELNFAEHIKYHESLAANRVDWKLYAKKDELYWKKYHDESGDMLTFSFQKLSGSSEEKIEKLSYLVQKAFLENKNWKMILGDLSLGPQGGGSIEKSAWKLSQTSNMNLLKKITPTFLLFFIFSFVLVFLLGEVENLFIYLGFLILFFQPWLKRAPRFLTNIALVLASLYLFVYYQFSLHPESALCFFLILTAFKFLQLHEQRDFYFLLHCHFLVIAGGALFNSNLYYMIFAILAIIVLIAMFQIPDFRDSHFFDREMFKNILQVFLMALPLFISLFIFFPRYRYFFPTLGSEQMGKIGYSGEINNSSISSLRSNGEAVMRVFVSNELPREQLYWRGRVLRITDGYNWRYHRTPYQLVTGSDQPKENLFKSQYYTLRNFQGDLIALDTPQQITSSYANFYSLQDKTFKTRNRNPQKNYTVYSNLESQKEKINPQDYLQLPDGLPEKVKSIAKGLASDSPRHYLTQIKQYLKENNFQYSLSPGSMQTLQDFLINKIGYCTHYSSLMGILLRLKGIPARLISGFQGGEYNELGQFYLLRSNDAHTWVEAYLDGRWERFDPTSYVEPLRIARGGQGFIEPYPWASSLKKYAGIDLQGTFVIQQYFQLQKFVDYVNTQVNLFFDNFNLDAQKELARKFKLNLKIFFSSAIVLPALFLMFLWLGLKWLKSPNQKDKIEATYVKFKKKLEKKGIPIESTWGPVELLGLLKNNREFAKVFEILELYIAIQYQSRKEAQLNKKFSKLVRQF